jgi:hypothetical protein
MWSRAMMEQPEEFNRLLEEWLTKSIYKHLSPKEIFTKNRKLIPLNL